MVEENENIKKFNEQEELLKEYTTKEDVIFEILLYILNNQLYRRGFDNVGSIEASYRRVYNKLPYFYELDKKEYVRQLNEINMKRLSGLISSYELNE